MVCSLVAGVLLVRSAGSKYDASGPGVLDTNYTVETTTSSSGTVESTHYKVTYKFEVGGAQYTGKDSLTTEPTEAGITVYYMANNPRENALSPNRAITFNLIAAGVAFLIMLVAYGFIPKSPMKSGAALQAAAEGVGDSGYEAARMKRGKYSAWVHVHIAFFLQMVWVALLAAWVLASVLRAEPTSYTVLGAAAFVAAAAALWVYADRWSCIEAFSSRFCSGLANLSILYVPVITLFYANYRGLKKLRGR
jgi:hypothetical protein